MGVMWNPWLETLPKLPSTWFGLKGWRITCSEYGNTEKTRQYSRREVRHPTYESCNAWHAKQRCRQDQRFKNRPDMKPGANCSGQPYNRRRKRRADQLIA